MSVVAGAAGRGRDLCADGRYLASGCFVKFSGSLPGLLGLPGLVGRGFPACYCRLTSRRRLTWRCRGGLRGRSGIVVRAAGGGNQGDAGDRYADRIQDEFHVSVLLVVER